MTAVSEMWDVASLPTGQCMCAPFGPFIYVTEVRFLQYAAV